MMVLHTTPCVAATLVSQNTSVAASSRPDGAYTVGYAFTVTQPGGARVTHLGVQDTDAAGAASDGILGAGAAVGLWNADGSTLLASATVTTSGTLLGSFRYVTLNTPVILSQGASYLLGAVVGGANERFLDSNPAGGLFVPTTGITLGQNRFTIGDTLSAPLTNGEGLTGRWSPANAQFSAVPEPSTLVFGMTGILGLLSRRRRV